MQKKKMRTEIHKIILFLANKGKYELNREERHRAIIVLAIKKMATCVSNCYVFNMLIRKC